MAMGVFWLVDIDKLAATNHRSGKPENMFLISN